MRRKTRFGVLLLAAVMVLVVAQSSFGAGFALYESSARGNALGGAMVGRADDPSALFYNPAGITQLPGMQFMAGATFIVPSTTVHTYSSRTGAETSATRTEDNVFYPPHTYLTYQYNDDLWFGLGIFSPFGLGVEFDPNWAGRFNSYKAFIESVTINPTVAYKVTDKLSAAVGLDAMWFRTELRSKINEALFTQQALDIDRGLKGDSWGFGWNAALHYKALDWLSLGFSYRSQVKQHVEGEVEFAKSPFTLLPASFFNNTDVSGRITLPAELFLGATFKLMDRLTWEVGTVWTQWSSFPDLGFTFSNPIYVSGGVPVTKSGAIKDYQDVWRINTGIEFKATNWLDLRLGYAFDQEPTVVRYVDYLLPSNDRHMFCTGVGFHWNKWTLDLSYTYLIVEERNNEFLYGRSAAIREASTGVLNSTFTDGDAHKIGVSVSYKF
jgi:long-chain fatty acid transport protein